MARYIQKEVQKVATSNDDETIVKLLLGLKDGVSTSAVKARVNEIGGTTIEELPFQTLLIEIAQSKVDEVITIEGVESVEFDREGEVMEKGNRNSHQVLTR